jgi:hypothetical protein
MKSKPPPKKSRIPPRLSLPPIEVDEAWLLAGPPPLPLSPKERARVKPPPLPKGPPSKAPPSKGPPSKGPPARRETMEVKVDWLEQGPPSSRRKPPKRPPPIPREDPD